MFVFLYRSIKFAFQGFFRNFWLSLVTVIILVLTLFSVTMVAGINFVADKTIESIKEKVDVSIYFKSEVTEDDIIVVRNRLENMSAVKEVQYVSKEMALQDFKERHKDDALILESIDLLEKNPLSATLIIKAQSIDQYGEILSVLDDPEYDQLIQDKNYEDNQKVIEELSNISKKIENIGIIISVVFIVITILIVFNTIRINIYTHREEIGIMKLVGATNWFVRAPFLIESVLYALFAVALCLAVLYPLLGIIAPQVDNFFEGYNLDLVQYFNTNIWRILGWQVGFAVVLSMISSSVAVGRYVRV